MPSGAKKRKAAKKKKEKESSSNASNQPVHSHGDDDLKHQDDKETDGGDVSSPASQDHHSHQHHFTEEEEEGEKREGTSNLVFIEGERKEGMEEQKVVAEEGNVVQAEKELKNDGDSEKKDVVIEYDELPEKSYDGGVSGSSSSSSSSNSDDESQGLKQTQHTIPSELAGAVDSLSVDAIHGDTVVQTCPIVGSHNVSSLNKEVLVDTSTPLNISEASTVVESELKENEQKLKSLEENVGFSAAGMDGTSNEAVEAIVQSSDNTTATSDDRVVQNIDEKLALSYGAPRDNDNNGAQHEKDYEVPKPVVAPTLPPVQTTSWKSCCGLFELLQGSGR